MSYSNFNTFKLFQNVGINSSSNYVLSMDSDGNNVSFHSSNSIDYNNVDIMSIKNIINKKQNEDLNLSSLTGTTINPVITINNNYSDCRIMTNLNVLGNINIIGNGIINTSLGIGTTSLNNGFTGFNTHTNSILDINGQTTIRGHILPSQNAAFDLGNAEYKIRHLFLSDNSLWIGDKHKIDVSNGTIKFRKRKTASIPTSINKVEIRGDDTEEDIKRYIKNKFGRSENPDISDIKLEEWHAYAQSKQANIKIEDIFQSTIEGDWDENDTTMDKLVIKNNIDVSGNINLTNEGMVKTSGIGSFGSVNCGIGTFTSLDANDGLIKTTGIGSFGSINCGVGTFTSLDSVKFGYLSTISSDIQTQFSNKQATITGAASSITSSDLTALKALISDGNGKVAVHTSVSSNELGYLDGVTDFIQNQLDGKSASTHTHNYAASTHYHSYAATDHSHSSLSSPATIGSSAVEVTGGYPLRIAGYYTKTARWHTHKYGHAGFVSGVYAEGDKVSLRIEESLWNEGDNYFINSDRRIKTNITDVPDNLALQQLRSIPCRYYEYIDKLKK